MHFIGVVKTATKRFPLSYLSWYELSERGDRHGVIAKHEDGTPKFLAFVWVDKDQRYFISTTSSLADGEPFNMVHWQQMSANMNDLPQRLHLEVQQPKACEIYYDACGKIDQHNRNRNDVLQIEKKMLHLLGH